MFVDKDERGMRTKFLNFKHNKDVYYKKGTVWTNFKLCLMQSLLNIQYIQEI